MIKFLHAPDDVRREITRVLSSGSPARAAVAFWGRDAERSLGITAKRLRECGLEIICDLESGACNPQAIRDLAKLGATVRYLSKLHAKVYLGDGEVVVGSANASSNGLGLEDIEVDGSAEACLVTTDSAVVSDCEGWFADMWNKATKVTEEALKRAESAWCSKRQHRSIMAGQNHDLLAVLRADLAYFSDRNIFVRVDAEEVSDAAIETAHAEIGGRWEKHGVFEDWDDMPPDADVIEFVWEKGKAIRLDGLFHSPKEPEATCQRTPTGSSVVICERLGRIDGYKVPSSGKTADIWKAAARRFAKSRNCPSAGCFISLETFAKQFLE